MIPGDSSHGFLLMKICKFHLQIFMSKNPQSNREAKASRLLGAFVRHSIMSGRSLPLMRLSKKNDLYALPLSLDGKKLSEPHHIPGKFNDVSFSFSGRPEENIFLLSGKKSVFVSYMECK